jgi:hypothetical protein
MQGDRPPPRILADREPSFAASDGAEIEACRRPFPADDRDDLSGPMASTGVTADGTVRRAPLD